MKNERGIRGDELIERERERGGERGEERERGERERGERERGEREREERERR
jgi:hypothetical protein